MQVQNNWLPLTEYAMRTGISISTIRRKIKSEAIKYKMEEGRYLIMSNGDILEDEAVPAAPKQFISSDQKVPAVELLALEEKLTQQMQMSEMRWRALDVRVSGLSKKLELLSEQISEVKMLVKIFEEKMDELR